MKTVIGVALPLILILAMFIVGLDLNGADFRRIGRQPRTLILGLAGQALVLPGLALVLVWAMAPPPATVAGLLLIAACPGGGISNYYAHLAGANVALSVSLTAVSCLLAPVMMPLIMYGYQQVLGMAFGYRAPLRLLLVQLLVMICLPILAGMLVGQRRADWIRRARPWLHRLSLWLLAVLIGFIVHQNAANFGHAMLQALPVELALIGLSAGIGYLAGYLNRLAPGDCLALAIEFPVRNLAIAATIAVTVFDQLEFAVFGAAYFLLEAAIMVVVIAIYRHRKPPGWPVASH